MTRLNDHKKFLEKCIPILRDIRNKKNICCNAVRDLKLSKKLNIVYNRIEAPTNKEQIDENPMRAYNNLRKLILEDSTLDDSFKLHLIEMMQ